MSEKDSEIKVPNGIDAPIEIDPAIQQFDFWTGVATLRLDDKTITGRGRVYLDLLPAPEFRFELTPDKQLTLKEAFMDTPLGTAVLESGAPVGHVRCEVTKAGELYSGYVEGQIDSSGAAQRIGRAVYLVINGPKARGQTIRRGRGVFGGRLASKVQGMDVAIDGYRSEKQERRGVFEVTHVARCNFDSEVALAKVDAVSSNLFRTLSLMKCRWVGILGPWLYDTNGAEIGFRVSVTKTMRNGGSISWCHEAVPDSFAHLFPVVHASFGNEKRADALQTAFHWLVEAEQCAGGVEGAIILQQAALECLAWLEVVQQRRLCSESGFKSLPAADKIRWLLSLFRIHAGIPDKSDSITSYAKAFNLVDIVDVLVDVRNALVHAEPKKAARLFNRKKGDEERGDLWYQVGGLLQQAVLASFGYTGKMLRRDVDAEYAVGAIRPVPWADVS